MVVIGLWVYMHFALQEIHKIVSLLKNNNNNKYSIHWDVRTFYDQKLDT